MSSRSLPHPIDARAQRELRRIRAIRSSYSKQLLAVALSAFFRREVFLRSTTRAAHDDAVLLDDLPRIGPAVVLALHAAARVALDVERMRVALLLVGAMLLTALQPPSEHGSVLPVRRYTKPPPGAFV
jgi:hypothetical protein